MIPWQKPEEVTYPMYPVYFQFWFFFKSDGMVHFNCAKAERNYQNETLLIVIVAWKVAIKITYTVHRNHRIVVVI